METWNDAKVSLTTRIHAFIKHYEHVSFPELSERVLGFNGNRSISLLHNLLLWASVSQEAIDALQTLLSEGRIHIWPAENSPALLGGGLLLPVARRLRPYAKPRWLPVTLDCRPPPAKVRRERIAPLEFRSLPA